MSRGLQNRVAPDGTIIKSPYRGMLMGNRGGRIHEGKTLRRQWASKQWIFCVLDFKNRQREVMGAGYTELFFLDEATALAAGHRPCFECQRARACEYANAFPSEGRSRAPFMDNILHGQRKANRDTCAMEALPDGSFVELDGAAYLLMQQKLFRWSMQGYAAPITAPDQRVKTLTPAASRTVLKAGFAPRYHPSLAKTQ